jgi:hypothetical protein
MVLPRRQMPRGSRAQILLFGFNAIKETTRLCGPETVPRWPVNRVGVAAAPCLRGLQTVHAWLQDRATPVASEPCPRHGRGRRRSGTRGLKTKRCGFAVGSTVAAKPYRSWPQDRAPVASKPSRSWRLSRSARASKPGGSWLQNRMPRGLRTVSGGLKPVAFGWRFRAPHRRVASRPCPQPA